MLTLKGDEKWTETDKLGQKISSNLWFLQTWEEKKSLMINPVSN